MGFNSRDLDNYITGHYGEDQFRDDEPEPEEVEDDSVCLNENECDQPSCPEHGDDISAALAAENEGMAAPDEDEA